MKKLTKEQVASALMSSNSAEVEGLDDGTITRVVYNLYIKEDGTIVDNTQEADAKFTSWIPYYDYADTLDDFKIIEDLFDGTYEDMNWKPFANVVKHLTNRANYWLEKGEQKKRKRTEKKNRKMREMKKLTKEQVAEALFDNISAEVEMDGEETRVVYDLYVKEDGTIVDNIQEADTCFSDWIPYEDYADTLEEFKEMEDLLDGTYEDMSWEPFAKVVEDLTDQANDWLEKVEQEKEKEKEKEKRHKVKNQIISFLMVNDYDTDILLEYLEYLGDVSYLPMSDFDMWVRGNNISPSELMAYNLCEFHITDAIFTLKDGMNLKNLVSMSEEVGRNVLSQRVGELASKQKKAPYRNAEIQRIINKLN